MLRKKKKKKGPFPWRSGAETRTTCSMRYGFLRVLRVLRVVSSGNWGAANWGQGTRTSTGPDPKIRGQDQVDPTGLGRCFDSPVELSPLLGGCRSQRKNCLFWRCFSDRPNLWGVLPRLARHETLSRLREANATEDRPRWS